jgi:hypothetical protein
VILFSGALRRGVKESRAEEKREEGSGYKYRT